MRMHRRLFQSILLLLLIPALQAISQNTLVKDTLKYAPIGKLIDIGGYRLHINCTGKGENTVVLIAGSSAFSFDWIKVQEKLSKETKICSCDRPGLAWSDAGPMPRTLAQDVYELHKLLKAANLKPPYILVGHSIGGIIARKYAKEYPSEVNGLVLVDATSENSLLNINGKIERVRLLSSKEKKIPPLKDAVDTFTKIPSQAEIEDLLKFIGVPAINPPYDHLPAQIQKIRLWAQLLPKYYIADVGDYWAEEFADMYSDSLLYKIGKKPLIVLCSTKDEYPRELTQDTRDSLITDKIKNQQKFLNISSNSKLITTNKSGHEIHLTEPELIVTAVKEIIMAIKTKSKLR
ncbi:MAG TPA: alpha/beta hydrolase [Chitinophagaceae bacterium]|nr:alpha/beta hydrolase [Chitinophagaceae bacterium]